MEASNPITLRHLLNAIPRICDNEFMDPRLQSSKNLDWQL